MSGLNWPGVAVMVAVAVASVCGLVACPDRQVVPFGLVVLAVSAWFAVASGLRLLAERAASTVDVEGAA